MGEIASAGQLRMSFIRWALVTVPLILLLGVTSGLLSNSGYENDWFATLDKPALLPPGWVFSVTWTILYILMGLSLAFILSARGARGRTSAIAFFIIQFILNLCWSPLFFAAHQVTVALAVILILIILVAITIFLFAKVRPLAAALLVPYFVWLCFASFLNYQFLILNPDAEMLAPEETGTQIAL